jgi:hypothetical protein
MKKIHRVINCQYPRNHFLNGVKYAIETCMYLPGKRKYRNRRRTKRKESVPCTIPFTPLINVRLSHRNERIKMKDDNICFRCCGSRLHKQRDCTTPFRCDMCDSTSHPTALHCYAPKNRLEQRYDGRERHDPRDNQNVRLACTEICGRNFGGKSCAKTLLVRVFPKGQPQHAKLMYM